MQPASPHYFNFDIKTVFTRSLQPPAVQGESLEDECELQDVGIELDVREEEEETVGMEDEVLNSAGKARLGRKRKSLAEEIAAAPSKQSRSSLLNHPLPSINQVATCAFYPNAVFSFGQLEPSPAAREESNISKGEVGLENTGVRKLSKEAGKDAHKHGKDTRNLELDTGVVLEGGEGDQDAIISGNLGMEEYQSSCQTEMLEDEDRTMGGEEEEKLDDLDQMGVQKEGNQPGNEEQEQQENKGLGKPLATSSQKHLQADGSESDDILVIDLTPDSVDAEEVQYVCSVTNEDSEKTKLSRNLAEGVKSAANDKSVFNEDAPHPKPAQAPAPAFGKSVENKLTEVGPGNSQASNKGTWNFVNKCWKSCICNHPKLCFQVKCPSGNASLPAKGNCKSKMNLANLWKHMQRVHDSQDFNLRCPACCFEVSCSALKAHMVNNHKGCKPKLSSCPTPAPHYSAYGLTLPVPPLNQTFVSPSDSHPELSKAVPENQVTVESVCAMNKVLEKHHPGTIWVNKDIFKR